MDLHEEYHEMEASTSHPMKARLQPLSFKILQAYFPHVSHLVDYIRSITHYEGLPENWLLKDGDPQEYLELLSHGVVCNGLTGDPSSSEFSISRTGVSISMVDLLDRAQARVFAKEGSKPTNIITQGYRLSGQRAEKGKGRGSRTGISNFFVNTMITALQSPEWELLLSRVGENVILHLLSETSIFVSLPNSCLCQLTGAPLVHFKSRVERLVDVGNVLLDDRSGQELNQSSTKRKSYEADGLDVQGVAKRVKTVHRSCNLARRALSRTVTETSIKTDFSIKSTDLKSRTPSLILPRPGSSSALSPAEKRPISDILFARASMFYARPARQVRTGHIMLGLPTHHILNRVKSRHWEESHRLAQDTNEFARDDAFKSRHVSKYILPKQYGLSNVFTVTSVNRKYEQFSRHKFEDREDAIKKLGPCKTPRRLKPALNLIAEMIRKHRNCGYLPLLDLACPSKLKQAGSSEKLDSTIILELVSEQSINPQTQLPPDNNRSAASNTTWTSLAGDSSYRTHAKDKPRFAEFMCSHLQVFRFVRLITKCVIPRAFFGCEKNFKLVMNYVKQFIKDNRFTSMSLHNVLQGFSTTECDWTLPPKHAVSKSAKRGRVHTHVPITESAIRRELSEEFLFWYFDSFVIPLLKTTFYITDSSAFRRRVLYFRQDDWDTLCQPLLDRLAATTFERIEQREAEQLLRQRKLGFSFVRLLPKDTGVRPIVNLRRRGRRQANKGPDLSINQILQTAFQILTYEKNAHASSMGATVFGHKEIYSKLHAFKKGIVDARGKLPPLYFVKVDVKACFDTIEQTKLLQILQRLISEDAYMIQRYGVVAPSAGKINRTYAKNALPDSEHPHFLNYAQQLATLLKNAIVSDLVVYPFAFREDIEQLLEEHISFNLVKIGHNYYRQIVGIPQGSVLSSLLCSFFYADLEQTSLQFALEDSGSTLLRLIDDYLFITTSLPKAKKFLEAMNRGHPEYGCFISPEKTLINFDTNNSPVSSTPCPAHFLFPWCGFLIDTRNLSVLCDYSRFHDTYLADSLTVERCVQIGAAFSQRMLQLNRRTCHPIFTDMFLNKRGVVITNVHQSFAVTAMKMHAYIRHLSGMSRGGNCLLFKSRKSSKGSAIGGPAHRNPGVSLPLKVIRQVISYTRASIRGLADNANMRCTLQEDVIAWLGLHAFYHVLSRKATVYMRAGILESLKEELAHQRFCRIRRKLGGIATDSLKAVLNDIKF